MSGAFFADSSQLFAQCIGIVTNVVYVGAMTAGTLWLTDKLVGNRVSAEDELAGLDIPELGVLAYPDDANTSEP